MTYHFPDRATEPPEYTYPDWDDERRRDDADRDYEDWRCEQ